MNQRTVETVPKECRTAIPALRGDPTYDADHLKHNFKKARGYDMDNGDFTITAALPEHEAAIRDLSDATHRLHRTRLPHFFAPTNDYQNMLIDAALRPQTVQDSGYRSTLLVACRANDLLGYVLVIWNTPDDTIYNHKTAMIADIGTFEHARGQGIATALLVHLEGQMKTHGWDSLMSDVWLGNDASHTLFQNAGYAAERTEYRLGTPPPFTQKEQPMVEDKASSNRWMTILLVFIVIGLIASFS